MIRFVTALLVVIALAVNCLAQEKPAPTFADVAYGEHENQVLDFWQVDSDEPAPLVVYIHGGGFARGSKSGINSRMLGELLDAGIHVASVEYRFIQHDYLPAAHVDSARAVQFLRSKAAEWNFDPKRVGGYGGSAGAQLTAYLAFHDDMADPSSDDPVARESTRLACVAPLHGQATMDLDWWIENIPGYTKPHRDPFVYFGTRDPAEKKAIVDEISIINHITPDDPPVYMLYRMPPDEPYDDSKGRGWAVHHVRFGEAMQERLEAVGVEAVLVYPGAEVDYDSATDFLIRKLTGG